MNPVLPRVLATLLVATAALVAPASVHASSRGSFVATPQGLQPSIAQETMSKFRVEGYSNSNVLIGTRECSVLSACNSFFVGAAKSVVVLDLDATRETVVGETCKGVRSTVPQLRCTDGDLVVSLQVLAGQVVIRVTTPGGRPVLDGTSTQTPTRFEFAEDATKSRTIGGNWLQQGTGNVYNFPAGAYKAFAPDLGRHCKPIQTNPGVLFTVPAGGSTTLDIQYRGTECTVQVTADVANVTVGSDVAPFDCKTTSPVGRPEVKTVCTGLVSFNVPLRLSATAPAGSDPYFEWVNNTCSRLPLDRTHCEFTPVYDYTASPSATDIHLSARASGTPPPPPDPAVLAVEKGAASPADGVAVKGTTDVPMLQLRASTDNGRSMLQSLTLRASGRGRDDLDLLMVRLVVDANGNGQADPGETVVAQGRPSADDGTLRLDLAGGLDVSAATDLIVVADLATQITSASAAAWGGTGVILALGLMAWPAGRRVRLVPALAAAVLLIAVAAGCGGSDAIDAPVADDPPVAPPTPPAPPVLLTYRLDLTAVEAVETSTPTKTLNISAMPIAGAVVTVQQ
ncbi:MAG: hypothetical protein ABI460_03585 [Caldimonas sp.]